MLDRKFIAVRVSLKGAIATTVCFFCAIGYLLLTSSMALSQHVGDSLLSSTHDKMRTNIDYFSSYKCEYRYGTYTSPSRDDRLTDKLPEAQEYKVDYELYSLGDDYCIKLPGDSEYLKKAPGDQFPPIMTVTRQGISLDFDTTLQNSEINLPQMGHPKTYFHPLNFATSSNQGSPMALLNAILTGTVPHLKATVTDYTSEQGSFIQLIFVTEQGDMKGECLLMPEKGYLPHQITLSKISTGDIISETYVVSTFEKEGHFFPLVSKLFEPKIDGTFNVRFIACSKFDPDYVPTERDLSLLLPKGTQFWDGVDPETSKTVYRESKDDIIVIDQKAVRNLYDGMYQLADERKVQAKAREAAAADAAKRKANSRSYFFWLNLLIVTIGATIYFARRRVS